MSVSKTPRGCFHYRMTHKGYNYNVNNFWRPGDPVTEEDEVMLRRVKDFYRKNGFSPNRSDMPQDGSSLKHRFRTWKNVLIAAGLPDHNDAENQRKRQNRKKPEKNDDSRIWKE